MEKLDIELLGWFWAINRNKVVSYYRKNFVMLDKAPSPHLLGSVLSFNYLNKNKKFIGKCVEHYFYNDSALEHDVFGLKSLAFIIRPFKHTLYEFIYAGFVSFVNHCDNKEMAIIFGITQKQIRLEYQRLDEEFKDAEDDWAFKHE